LIAIDSVEQRVNHTQSSAVSEWTAEITVPATSDDLLYIVSVNVTSEYDNLQYRIICNWLDFGKTIPGRPSPPSSVVKPATYCICKSCTNSQSVNQSYLNVIIIIIIIIWIFSVA